MYPNPQDVLPLPPRPDLDQYRKRAKELAAVDPEPSRRAQLDSVRAELSAVGDLEGER